MEEQGTGKGAMMRTSLLLWGLLAGAVSMVYGADAPRGGGEAEVFALWNDQVPWPSLEKRHRPEGAVDVLVHRACAEYRFLHDNAVVWHGDTLFAGWYNCPRGEIQDSSSIRGRRSRDGEKTWSEVEVIAADDEGKSIYYVPVAFLSHANTLYAYISTMTGTT
jgi:hypothetical protein